MSFRTLTAELVELIHDQVLNPGELRAARVTSRLKARWRAWKTGLPMR
jgi:hypothetical protein